MTSTTGGKAEPEGNRFASHPLSWRNEGKVEEYLNRMDVLPPRRAGEDALTSVLPSQPRCVLDLGAGDGRLGALVASARPTIERVVLVDNSPPMLARARAEFASNACFEIHEHDLKEPVSAFGRFDVIVSGFAIHHLPDDRKRTLYREIADCLEPGGIFANLEVVSSPTPELHQAFLDAIGRSEGDPEDRLADVGSQLTWLEDAGLTHVDCLWKWRGFALMIGSAG